MTRPFLPLLAAALAVAMALAAPPAAAQGADAASASTEELMMLFQKQKSRGLRLAPNTAVTAPAEAAASAGAGAGATTVAGTAPPPPPPTGVTTEAATGAVVPVAYQEIDRAEQVNLRVEFDFDSAVLRDSEKPKLATLCEAMRRTGGVFRIVGHTDAAGTDAYNEKLSLLRAEEVKRHLVGECGLPAERLQAVGVGKRHLYDAANPRSEVNRRVEFQAMS